MKVLGKFPQEIGHITSLAECETRVWIKDENLRYIACNAALREKGLLGRTSTELFGHDGYSFEALDEAVLRTGQPVEELQTVVEDGQKQYWLTRKFPIRMTDGKTYVGGRSVKITEFVTGHASSVLN